MFRIAKIVSNASDGITDTLYLVHQSNVFVCGAITQHLGTKTLYVESLDTTGYCVPRTYQRNVTSSLIDHILNADFGLFAVFSHPKKETMFGKSSLNSLKGHLGPRRLQEFWVAHFSRHSVFVFSNFCDRKSIPFTTMDEVVFFHDDPKQKLGVRDVSVNTFFEMLLHRKDFQRGSLVYMVKKSTGTRHGSKDGQHKCECSCGYCMNRRSVCQVSGCGENGQKVECGDEAKMPNMVRNAVLFLRSSDFSTLEKGIEATRLFLERFSPRLEPFSVSESKCEAQSETAPTVLMPRRR